jgi:DNA-binding transcriptional LysR family regulator
MDFDPTLLRAFVAVKETGGFTRAAERLHLTQSAISHQIRKLEEQVGRPLLRRTTRRLTVTEDGEDFLRYAQQILDTLDAMTRRFQPSPISGAVRFGVPDNFMGDRLPPLLSQFARGFPAVRLEVSVSMHLDLRAMIRAGELDLAVVMSPPHAVEGTRLRRTQLVWAAAEAFEAPKGASLPLAFFPKPCVNREVAGGGARSCGGRLARSLHVGERAGHSRGGTRRAGGDGAHAGRSGVGHEDRRRALRPAGAAERRLLADLERRRQDALRLPLRSTHPGNAGPACV